MLGFELISSLIRTPSGKIVNFIPSGNAVAVVPHDTDTFQSGLLFVGTTGDVKVMLDGMSTFVTFKNIPDGSFLPVYIKAVHTDTTATDMLMCY